MATMQGKHFSLNLSDAWAQRLVGGAVLAVGCAVAVTVVRTGGIKLLVEVKDAAKTGTTIGAKVVRGSLR